MSFDLILPFLRPIAHLIRDPHITEIMVNGSGRVFVERNGLLEAVADVTVREQNLRVAVRNLARVLGDDVSEERPLLDSRLPDGSRVAAALPPVSLGGTTLTIRKFHSRYFSVEELVQIETLTRGQVDILQRGIEARDNILISGGTGTGKTTFLNSLLRELATLCPDERVAVLEDTPELVCSMKYDARKQVAELHVSQVLPATPGEPRKKPLHIPLRLGLIGANGQDLDLALDNGAPVDDGIVHVTKRSQVFRFTGVPSRPVPSLLRGFSAPVNLTIDLSDADLAFLSANDSDLYNRWQAAQTYAARTIIASVRTTRAGQRPPRATEFAKVLGAALADASLQPAYRAQLLSLPSEADIAREIARDVDPAAIHRARRALLKHVGQVLGDQLEGLYREQAVKGVYSPDARSAGKRALRNAAMALLAARGGEDDVARVVQHYRRAANNTDETMALVLLSDMKSLERANALEHFYERWKGDHLVIDKWFSLQAMSSLPGTLATVERLTRHPLFSMQNPNKVRSLIGAFATGNALHFNQPSGKGYNFVAERVLELDGFNPQIAARMCGAFRSWRTLEAGRRKLAKSALSKIAKHKGLSRDVYEIVSKMLDEAGG